MRYFRTLRIMDRNGNFLNYIYVGGTNGPSRIEDQLGRQLTMSYSTVGTQVFVSRVTDQGGREVSFQYEASGADNGNQPTLRSVTGPMADTTTFHYTTLGSYANLITSLTFPGGNTPYTQTYGMETLYGHTVPMVTSQKDAFNNTTTLSYDNATSAVTANYPDGTSEKYIHFGPVGLLKSFTDAANKAFEFAKDGDSPYHRYYRQRRR